MLSIVIVNYYSLDDIQVCLRTLEEYHPRLDYEIIIINNGDNEDEIVKFLKEFRHINWANMGYNSGFARANNKGISLAQYDYVLLLNPDTIFIGSILAQCLELLGKNDNMAALGVQLLHKDLSFQISGNYFMKGGINHLLPLPIIGSLLKGLGSVLKVKKPHLVSSGSLSKVDWISGAFLLTTKTTIESAGMLSNDFFLYAEEIEWCSRLGQYGDLFIAGDLKIIHAIGGTSPKSFDNEYYDLYSKKGLQLMLSNHLRIRKQFGVFWLLFLYTSYFLSTILYLPFALLKSIFIFNLEPSMRALKLAKNIVNLAYYIPIMIWHKPYFYKVLP